MSTTVPIEHGASPEQSRTTPTDQSTTPYADALLRHRDALRAPFMIPGHSAGVWGSTGRLSSFMGAQAVALDIPQLLPGVDLEPDSPYARSRELAAQAWNAERTWFLTNGASQGNRMALMAVQPLGEVVVAQRSMHSSFFDGLVVSGLSPRFVGPTIDPVHGIAHGVTPAGIDAELRRAKDSGKTVAAVAVVSPSYFGVVADVREIAAISHRHGVPLIVDASWGAHFGFHEEFPESPTVLGADIVISSVHKLGGSLTQTALLHVMTGVGSVELESQLERAFRLTESTSPNSLLLASLDIARSELASNRAGLDTALASAKAGRELVRQSEVLRLPDEDFLAHPDVIAIDPLHLAIDVRKLGLSGTVVKSVLAQEHGVFVEIASETSVVALIGAGQNARVEMLIEALESIASPRRDSSQVHPFSVPQPPSAGEAVMTPREAYLAPSELVPTGESVGRISADMLAAYPPGVPNVVPGERVTQEAADFLRSVAIRPAGYVRGAADPLVQRMRVLRVDQ